MSQEQTQTSTSKKYRIQTAQDLAGQIKFTRYYTQTLRENYQAEPKNEQFVSAVNLCGALLTGEPNILGIKRIIELFGEELAVACALAAHQRYQAGQTSSQAENGSKIEHTLGGTFFYLMHKWHDKLVEPVSQVQSMAVELPQVRLSPQTSLPWPQLKIPYLYPNSPDWVSPELADQEPEQLAEYNKLREELGELTGRVFSELVTATLADYSPVSASLVDTFAVPVSASPVTYQPTSNKVLPVERSTPPTPSPVTSFHAQNPAAPAGSQSSLQPEAGQPETANLPVANIELTEPAAEKAEATTPPAFLQALANIYGETAVYGSGINKKSRPKSR